MPFRQQWDDRLGGGFSNASTVESQWDYRFLSIRAFLAWGDVNDAADNETAAAHWRSYAASGAAFVKAQLTADGGAWTDAGKLGVHAAAEALNTFNFSSPSEAAVLLGAQLNDQGTICSQSRFNDYWILQGLGNGGALDKAVFKVQRCWGTELELGATCFFEVSNPEWKLFMRVGEGPSLAPYGYNGNTSLCHPWSAGAAPWLTKNILGVTPSVAGYGAVRVAPHVTPEIAANGGLRGAVPTPHGAVELRVSREEGLWLSVPTGCSGGARLELSEVLLHRLGWLDLLGGDSAGALEHVAVSVSGAAARALLPARDALGPLFERELESVGRARGGAGVRSRVAVVELPPGTHSIKLASPSTPPVISAAAPPPFPPLEWPARIVQIDSTTQGSWVDKYGTEGFVLFNFKGGNLQQLPDYVSTFGTMDVVTSKAWTMPVPDADPRALQDPKNVSGARAIGFFECGINELPQYTFGIDIALTEEAEAAGRFFQVALYIVDFDLGFPTHTGAAEPRRLLVDVKSGWPELNPIAPTQYLGPEVLEGGAWVVVQANQSLRLRVTCMPGATAVASAVMFDAIE